MIELYDQALRNKGGGDMLEYLKSDMPNADFVYSRIGKPKENAAPAYYSASRTKRNFLRFLNPKTYFHKISRVLMSQEDKKALELGKFRLSGEIHLHMYDRFSLARLLGNTGFRDIILTDAFSSKIFNWEKYKLDFSGTDSRKPDSLFVEAIR